MSSAASGGAIRAARPASDPEPPRGMPDKREIYLTLEGKPVSLQVRRETTGHSLHTGRELAELHGWVVTADTAEHQWLAQALRDAADREVRAIDGDGEFAGKWQMSWNSY